MLPQNLPFYPAEAVWKTLPFARAIKAIEEALKSGLDPENDKPRLFSDFPNNAEFLFMPAQGKELSGVKMLTVAPNNPAKNLDKIQGLYVLFDSETASPLAVIDGISLTAIRTPAVALTAVKHLAVAAPEDTKIGEKPKVLTFGAGIQAVNHIKAAHSIWPEAEFTVIGRRPERVKALQKELLAAGINVAFLEKRQTDDAVSEADIILCCTSSETPLFDGNLPKNTAIIAATGAHGLARREIDLNLVKRADVVVEAKTSALLEGGNLVGANSVTEQNSWSNLQDLLLGKVTRTPGKPALYTGVGMSWEDLVIASVVYKEGNLP